MLKLVALFFTMLLTVSTAAAGSPETYKDIIDKAYSLSLQKDRGQAILLLVNSIKKETKKTSAPRELFNALDQVSTIFFSEKAQQLYELGLSLKTSDTQVSLVKINESLKLESDNYLSLVSQMQIMLANGDCSSALEQGKKLHEINLYYEPLDLIVGQAAVCAGQFETYLQIKNKIDFKRSSLTLFWHILEVEYLNKTAAYQRAKDMLSYVQKTDPNFPEADYWQWKLSTDTKAAQKFVSGCKSLNAKLSRKYLPEPMLCKRIAEVESFLKKNSSSDI